MSSFIVLALLLAAASAQTVVNTKNLVILGYKLGRDVTSYRNLAIDASNIRANLIAGRFAAAQAIYVSGKNARRSSGTLRNLQDIANATRTGEGYFDTAAAFFKTPLYIAAFTGGFKPTSVREKLIVGIQWTLISYIGHELDVAKKGLAAGLGPLAVEETDDAFGIWYGYPQSDGVHTHVRNVETWTPCAGGLQARWAGTFTTMRAASISKNAASFNAAYNTLFKTLIPETYLRSIVYASGQRKRTIAWQTNALGYLKIIQAFLAPAAKTPAAQLSSILASRTVVANPVQVATLVRQIAAGQGITSARAGLCAAPGR